MKARLLYMNSELRKQLGISLFQVFNVDRIQVYTSGRKYPRESKHIHCTNRDTGRKIMFYWYEVECYE